jgi:glycerol 2-dehydrogenase (NADP+)
VAKGIVALPKSVTASRIESNFNGAIEASTKLIDKDIQVLDEVATGGKQKRFIRPPWGVPLGFEDWNE